MLAMHVLHPKGFSSFCLFVYQFTACFPSPIDPYSAVRGVLLLNVREFDMLGCILFLPCNFLTFCSPAGLYNTE